MKEVWVEPISNTMSIVSVVMVNNTSKLYGTVINVKPKTQVLGK